MMIHNYILFAIWMYLNESDELQVKPVLTSLRLLMKIWQKWILGDRVDHGPRSVGGKSLKGDKVR